LFLTIFNKRECQLYLATKFGAISDRTDQRLSPRLNFGGPQGNKIGAKFRHDHGELYWRFSDPFGLS